MERVFTAEEIAAVRDAPGGTAAPAARCCGRHAPDDPLHGSRPPGARSRGAAPPVATPPAGPPRDEEPPGEPCALAGVFAGHLVALRRASRGPEPGPLRCCGPPVTDGIAEPTPLPHLVAVRRPGPRGEHAEDHIEDHVVWEILDGAALRAWLPGAGPPEAWTARLDRLLALRALLREPPARDGDALTALRERLDGGHFSMRFVLQNPGVVARTLAALDLPDGPRRTTAAPGAPDATG